MNRIMVVVDVMKPFVRDIWCGVRAVAIVVVEAIVGVSAPGLRRSSLGHLLLSRLALPTAAGLTWLGGTTYQPTTTVPVGSVPACSLGGKPKAGPYARSGALSRRTTR